MLDVVSLCPFPAGGLLWEAAPGQHSLTVLVKGTIVLVPGEATIAPEQDPLREEHHWDGNGLASLRWPGDFAPLKRKVDVMLVGHAYAPRGEPVRTLTASLSVGEWFKSLRVTGDRTWALNKAGAPEQSQPAPFARMPLRYERAALSADNPVGVDPHAPAVLATPAHPNLESMAGSGAACFGPLAPAWRPRRRLLDEAASFWAHAITRDPATLGPPPGPAPPRFDFAYFNAAPPDQQIDLLRPGTPITLENLDPDHPRIETRLPSLRPQVFRVPPEGTPKSRVEEIILRCDALWIDTDRGVAVLTWRGVADITDPARIGRIVVAADPTGKKLRWEQLEKRLGEVTAPTLRLPGMRGEGEEPPPPDPMAMRHDSVRGTPTSTPGPAISVKPITDAIPDSGIQDMPTNPLDNIPTPVRVERKPASAKRPGPPVFPVRGGDTVNLGAAAPPPPVSESAPSTPSRPLLVLGAPLGKPPVAPPAPPVQPAPPAPAPAGPGSTVKLPRPAARTVPSLRKDLTVERYAEILVALAAKGADRAAVLRAALLTEPAWSLVDQQWKKAMARETEQGSTEMTDAFDDAYVAAQDCLRRPIGVGEYARLQVAVERGAVGRVLAELELELSDLVRLQRVWSRRLVRQPDLAAELARAADEARRSSP